MKNVRSASSIFRAAAVGASLTLSAFAFAAPPSVGPNVNMVSGTKWPQGDPFLTKQNEPSIAVSSRNSRHLLAGSNDYRLVPVEIAEELDDPEAWIQIYKSIDGGASWRAMPLGGCPINIPECNDSTGLTAALKAKKPNFGADPTVRPGPYGTFFLSFIAGTRDSSANGVVAVQRFVDKNNDVQRATDVRGLAPDGRPMVRPAEDPILPDVLSIIDVGTPGQGKDKPWLVADVGRRSWNGSKTCTLLSWTNTKPGIVTDARETVGAFNVYISYANFTGGSNKPDIFVATSSDCGTTFGKPTKISSGGAANQGTSSAIDPLTGAVYIVWRGFFIPATGGSPAVPNQILMSKSTDGGASWSKPIIVASGFNPYDQGATGVSFRTLDFPSVAVSVSASGQSRVHVAWSQRKVAPSTAPPTYACPSANPGDCDARIVVATSTNGGTTFGAPKAVDDAYTVNVVQPNGSPAYTHSRGHQVQASLTFSAGKLLATWLDQREDHTQGMLVCPATNPGCTNVSERVEVRRAAKNSNLDAACHIDVSQPPLSTLPASQKAALDQCYNPAAVWTTYMTDGSPGLVRRHTLDAYTAMADPADLPNFQSSRASQYTFGNTAQTAQGTYEIVQKEVSPPNLPMFSNGKSAFIGDYIDSAGQLIVATGDVAQPYKFNAGVTTNGAFVTGGFAPAFHVAFTDNRDVIPPLSGDWTTPACQTTDFTKDANGNITGVNVGATCGPGRAGNRNQNIYTAAIAENSVAFAGANSKLLDSTTERSFVLTVRNLTDIGRWYALTLPAQPAGGRAAFKLTELPSGTVSPAFVFVQPKSSSARAVWAKSSTGNAKVTVLVRSLTGAPTIPPNGPPTYTPDNAFTSQVLLNPDANAPLVKNGDGTGPLADKAIDNVGNVVLSNAVLTNNALSNNVLTNNALSNNALTNAVLSNVVLSNAVLSNLDPANAALSNDPLSNNALTNAALSNVVLSNAVLSNNALSNAVLSNVVLSNNTLNAALTNLNPANVALSNAVLSNNALTNVVLSNLDPNAALSNAMLTNNALTNAVLSNVALSNAALSNNALSNNVLSNAVLSNAPLGDGAHGGDPEALSTIETGAVEIAKNSFQTTELANSNFKETTFTIRNRGNIDTILALKLMLRDAICTGAPSYTCTPPPGYKLQLVLRKVALVPVAIPPTGPAVSTGRSIRVGIAQANTEVSNVSDLPLIDPSDPNFGKFLPDDPNAAMLSLAAGEYAYATIRAIGVGGASPPNPSDLLQWGVKTVTSNANSSNGPLVIRTLNFPAVPPFIALNPATPTFRTFGGIAPITGAAVCADKFGNLVLNGVGAPTSGLGALGNFYIDTAAQTLYGPKTASGWPAGTPLIGNGPSGPQASVPCPPGAIAMGSFTTDASFNSAATVTFTPKYWGDFYMLANVADTGAPPQTDRQVIKVTVQPHPTTVTFTPSPLVYNNNGASIDLRPSATSDRVVGTGVLQPIVFSATGGACHLGSDSNSNYTNYTLFIDSATGNQGATCVVTANQAGNEIYAPAPANAQTIFIDRATQNISFTPPADDALQYRTGNAPATLVASVTSPTAPTSNIPVTFASTGVCTTSGTNGATLSLAGAGSCSVVASVGEDANYKPAALPAKTFHIAKANQNIALVAPNSAPYNASFTVSATSSSPTADPSGISITFGSTTSSVCTIAGATVSIVTVGTCTITADQGGDGNYNAAPQASRNITITKADQNIVFGAAPSLTFGDSPGTVSATSTSPTAPPSGTAIIFSSQSTSVCTTGGVNGATVTIVAAGPCTIAADQAASTNYNAAPQVTQSFNIAKAPVQFTVEALYFTSLGDTTTSVTGKLSRPGHPDIFPPDAPTIAVAPNNTTLTSGVPGGVDGTFTATGTTPVPGTYSLTFNYAGSDNFAASGGPPTTSKLRVEGFSSAGTMMQPRARHRAVLLDDGRVLIAGGFYTNAGAYARQATSEVYCPDTMSPPPTLLQCPNGAGTFSAVGSLSSGSDGLTLTKLLDGRVLKVGGKNVDLEIFDPATNAWTHLAAALPVARAFHQATLLTCTTPCSYNGKVLITGGDDGTAGNASANTLSSTLIFDPADNTLSAGPDMSTPRDSHSATVLFDGRVLIAGGEQLSAPSTYVALNSAEIFDPAAPACAPATFGCMVAAASMTDARFSDGNVLLGNHKVLIAGGSNDPTLQRTGVLASAEIYDPGTNTWAYLSSGLNESRRAHSLTLLYDGWALAVGGFGPLPPPADIPRRATSELFDPGFTQFDIGDSLATPRARHRATRLLDGRVLITGGTIDITPPNDFVHRDSAINSAEFYNSAPPP